MHALQLAVIDVLMHDVRARTGRLSKHKVGNDIAILRFPTCRYPLCMLCMLRGELGVGSWESYLSI